MERSRGRFPQHALVLLLAAVLPMAHAGSSGEQVLRITGVIDAHSADRIVAFIDGGGRRIVIDSEGGDAEAGLRIGEKLVQADVEVVVNRYCFSSCANYVFVPARSKRLNEGAVLGFHGGLSAVRAARTEGMPPQVRAMIEAMARSHERQEALFRRIGVDSRLLAGAGKLDGRVAPQPGYRVGCAGAERSYTSEKAARRALAECMRRKQAYVFTMTSGLETVVYFPSQATLERHGVRGIGAYPYPEDRAGLQKAATDLEFRIELVGDVD